jgi:nuclear-control-of-ATPase protein 2
MSQNDIQNVMDTMDMSVVSLQYEKQLPHALKNIVTGDIVRMLLIQVQFIKKELMVAMGAIDELMRANQLNLQMLATIPTFIVLGGMYASLKGMTYQIFKRTSEKLHYDPGEVATEMRNNLRDIERLLNLQNRPDWKKHHLHDCETFDDRQIGHLLLLLHHLKKNFELHRDLLDEDDQDRFEEDVNDLMEEGLHVSQQLAVIQRMYHSHPFLQRSRRSTRWLLG